MHRLSVIGFAIFGGFAMAAVGFLFFRSVAREGNSHLHIVGPSLLYDERPFTGLTYELYPSGSLLRIAWYWQGLKTGTEIHWHGDGSRWIERRFLAGVPHGEWRMWHESGRVESLMHYREGKADGEFWAWREDGRVAEYSRFENGEPIARKSWLVDGVPFHNYVYRKNLRVGVQGGEFCKIQKGRRKLAQKSGS